MEDGWMQDEGGDAGGRLDAVWCVDALGWCAV